MTAAYDVVSAHALVVVLYVVPAVGIGSAFIGQVPRWVWIAVMAVAAGFAMAALPPSEVPLTAARLVQAGGAGLLTGSICALPWLMLHLGLGSFAEPEAPLGGLLEIAVVLAFLAGGGLTALIEVVTSGVMVGLAPSASEVARWAAMAAMHGMWLGLALAAVGACLAIAVGYAAPSLGPDSALGVAMVVRVGVVLAVVPLVLRVVLRGVAEVFARILTLAT